MKTGRRGTPLVRTTSYRNTARPASDPPGAGHSSPLERSTAGTRPGAAACPRKDPWDTLAANNKRRDQEHDKAVATLSVDALLGAWNSLKAQKVGKPATPEEWWIARRWAALSRRLLTLQPQAA